MLAKRLRLNRQELGKALKQGVLITIGAAVTLYDYSQRPEDLKRLYNDILEKGTSTVEQMQGPFAELVKDALLNRKSKVGQKRIPKGSIKRQASRRKPDTQSESPS
jgi:hypothetical protein